MSSGLHLPVCQMRGLLLNMQTSLPTTFYSSESFAVSPEFNATLSDHDAGQIDNAFISKQI